MTTKSDAAKRVDALIEAVRADEHWKHSAATSPVVIERVGRELARARAAMIAALDPSGEVERDCLEQAQVYKEARGSIDWRDLRDVYEMLARVAALCNSSKA